jgi:branched-chain amino acid transport system substrate-binding protein
MMNDMSTRRMGIAVALVACAVMSAPMIFAAGPMRIGAILAATGNNAAQGQYIHDGIQLAVEEINKRGGVNGSKIEITYADSGSDPQTAADAFNAMEASLHPLFYLSYASNVGMALAPMAETSQVVLVGLVTSAIDFTKGRQWVFRYWPLGPAYIPPLLRILKDLKVKDLGIVYQNDDFGKEQKTLMTASFTGSGGSVLAQSFELKDTEYARQIAALKDQEAIYIAGSGVSLPSVTRQLKTVNYRGYILMPAGGADPALFGLPEMSGVYVAGPIIHNPSYLYAREAGTQFFTRFKKQFNQWAANGYDSVKLICGLLEDRVLSRQAVREAMSGGFQYSGVFGDVRLKAGGHDLTFSLYPTQILNGTLAYR